MRFFLLLLLLSQGLSLDAEENPLLLRQRLHDQVAGHTALPYRQVWDALLVLDGVPGKPGTVRLIYTRREQPAERRDRGQNDPDSWNREHLWPKSHGFPEEENPAYTDLHNLRPADRSVNTQRSDRDFDDGGDPHPEAEGVRWDKDSWEVPDEVKGDVARAMFYMALRYDGTGSWTDRKGRIRREPRLVLIEGDSPETQEPLLGRLSALLRWNRDDPPDEAERTRDAGVKALQGNANPFVEDPGLVERLWGVPAAP